MNSEIKLALFMSEEEHEAYRRRQKEEILRRQRLSFLAVYDAIPNEDNILKFSERIFGLEDEFSDRLNVDLSKAFSIYFGNQREYYCYAINSQNLLNFINAAPVNPTIIVRVDEHTERSLSFARDFLKMKSQLTKNPIWIDNSVKTYRTYFFDLFVENSKLKDFNNNIKRQAQLDLDEKIVAMAMYDYMPRFSWEPASEEKN